MAAVVFALTAGTAGGEPTLAQKLWADFDPRAEPLEIETIRKWTENGRSCHEFYFVSETVRDGKVRIYAIYSAPTGGRKLPGMLHIHGGGQTAYEEWLKFWNARGYAALTFNWGGYWKGRERYAIWPESLRHCNHFYAGGQLEAVKPTPAASSWYHWTLAGRRALTVLERQKEVDPKRLGIFGVSMGGTIVWPFAGIDKRVRAACAIYGVGWNSYPPSKYVPDPKADDAGTRTWRKTMAPEAYASLIEATVLLLNATNDQHGKMDRSYDTLAAMTAPWAVGYTPRYRHHIAEDQGRDLPLWMDAYLKGGPKPPGNPVAAADLDDAGVPRLTVRPDRADEVGRVDVYYAVSNDNPLNRYWRPAASRKSGGEWTASLPVLDTSERMFAFANVRYRSGWCLASNFVAVVPAELGEAKATDEPTAVFGDFAKGLDGFLTHSTGTDPCAFRKGIGRARGPAGRWGVRQLLWAPLFTHKIGDPKYRGLAGTKLAFEVFCPGGATLKLALDVGEFAPGAKRYKLTKHLPARKGWQRVAVEPGEFRTDTGKALKRWADGNMLEIASEVAAGPKPVLADFRWVGGPP